jgi:hypothetical protein
MFIEQVSLTIIIYHDMFIAEANVIKLFLSVIYGFLC